MEKKWYKVTFYAPMDEADLKAMDNCFFDAMSESMQIDGCECLEMERSYWVVLENLVKSQP